MVNDTRISRRGLGALSVAGAAFAAGAASAHDAAPVAVSGPRISADDKLDIIELMARYAWAYDTSNEASLSATFTPDGVLEVFGKPLVEGRENFGPFLAMAADMRGAHGWQHLTDHHVFTDYDGASCKVFSYYTMPEAAPDGGSVQLRAMGYYISHCVRTPEGWLFSKREVIRWSGKQPF